MKKCIFILLVFLGVTVIATEANTSSTSVTINTVEGEKYVCTVDGWNMANGESQEINIYLLSTDYNGTYYIGREVYPDGSVDSIYGVVQIVTNPRYTDSYRYSVKTGLVGAYLFNSRNINERYIR